MNISLSSSEMKLFNRYGGGFVQIPNAVEPSDFKPSRLKSKRILFVGRLSRQKGILELLMAFKGLVKTHPEFELHLAGSGPKISGRNIVYHGKIKDRHKLARLYSSAYMFVLPSHSEGLPNVLLEAGASGLPVVATDVGGIPDVIEPNKNGILIKPGDWKSLLKAMSCLVEDTMFASELGRANRKKITNDFSWKKVIASIENFYKEVLHG
jgi:glycosyltransferase involved in cell wall biosynthesis